MNPNQNQGYYNPVQNTSPQTQHPEQYQQNNTGYVNNAYKPNSPNSYPQQTSPTQQGFFNPQQQQTIGVPPPQGSFFNPNQAPSSPPLGPPPTQQQLSQYGAQTQSPQGFYPTTQQPQYGAPPTQQQLTQPQYGAPPTQNQLGMQPTQPTQQYGAPPTQYGAPPTQQFVQQQYGAPPTQNQLGMPQQPNQFGPPPTQFGAIPYGEDPNMPNRLITTPAMPLQNVTSIVNDAAFSPTTGQRKQSKIDPSQMPSPAKKRYPQMYQRVEYATDSQENPPTGAGRMTIIDRGCVSPRLCRASLRAIPQTKDLLAQSGIMMGAIITPLADLEHTDMPNQVPLIDYTANEIVRCNRCRAYINPHVKFVNMGKDFVCNFCGFTNEVPRWYMYNLDGYGKRRDLEQRPELLYGAVDYIATKEYVTKEAKPLTYAFVLDVGANSLNQHIFQSVVSSLKTAITNIVVNGSDLNNCRVTFITYGRTIHFYNLKGQHPQVMVVGDTSQDGAGFVPFPETSLLTFQELVEGDFLDKLVSLATTMQESDNVMGSAIVSAQALVAETGGRIIVFSSQLPTVGQGRMQPREDFKIYGTDKEKSLFNGQLGFWRFFAQECSKRAICVDMYLFGSGFMETSTLTIVTQMTNGHCYLYHHFNEQRDEARLLNDLTRNLSRNTGYDGLMKVRCSSGISLRRYFGNFSTTNEEDMDLAGIDADTSFGVELKHDSKLDENIPDHYMQTVLLYTTRSGVRTLRVMTLKLGIATTMSNLFKKADMDASLSLMARLIVNQVVKNRDSLDTVRSMINNVSIDTLAAYRKHCSQTSSPGQLILPEALKLLPVYYLGLSKTPCLRQGTDVMLDERINMFNILHEMSSRSTMLYCYPYLFAIHNMPESEVVDGVNPETNEEIMYALPPQMSLTSTRIETTGMYLMNDGYSSWWWVGRSCPPELINDVFGVDSVDDIPVDAAPKPNLETATGKRVQLVLEELSRQATRNGPVRVYKERDQNETQFFARLVEDRYGNGSMNYVEYLCWLHKEIQGRLSY